MTESENENFDITDPIIRDLPTRIQRNHPVENIIGEIDDGRKTREKTRLNYRDMVRYVCMYVIHLVLSQKMSKKLC